VLALLTSRDAGRVPWAPFPLPPHDPILDRVAEALDPVLVPLRFAPGQLGASDAQAQVIYCRGLVDSLDGSCVDLVVVLEAAPDWRITDVRYAGFPSDRMYLAVPSAIDLDGQLDGLVRTLADELN
jgi:hypothetical protein